MKTLFWVLIMAVLFPSLFTGLYEFIKYIASLI